MSDYEIRIPVAHRWTLFWLLGAATFAGLFAWAFIEWQAVTNELQIVNSNAMECTRIELLSDATGAFGVFYGGIEYILPEATGKCVEYYKAQGVTVYDESDRRLTESHSNRRQMLGPVLLGGAAVWYKVAG